MRRLSDHHTHILSVVAKHGRICIGLPVDPDWAPIADDLRRLAKWKFLNVEDFDDGPVYTVSNEGKRLI